MGFELLRDGEGRPTAIRIRIADGVALRRLVREAWTRRPNASRSLARAAQAVGHASQAVAGSLRAGIPDVALRRDADGRPSAIVLRVGGMRPAPPAGERSAPGEPRRQRLSSLAQFIGDRLTGWIPRAQATRVADPAAPQPTVVIEARPDTISASLFALWQYRGFYGFLFKEIMMRKARGTLLGFWWLILRPLIPAVGFLFAFTFVAPVATGHDVPYPVFFLSGFIPWRLFQGTLTLLPRSLMWTRGIMQRTYFPRLLVPFASFGPLLVELGMLCVVFAIVVGMASWGPDAQCPLRIGLQTFWLLPCLIGALMFAMAFGMVISIIALFFRDIVFTVSPVAQMFMFVTPVLYPATFVPGSYRWVLYSLNPMAQMVTVSRWALTGRGEFEPLFLALAFGTILVAFAAGVTFFLRAETHLGDQL